MWHHLSCEKVQFAQSEVLRTIPGAGDFRNKLICVIGKPLAMALVCFLAFGQTDLLPREQTLLNGWEDSELKSSWLSGNLIIQTLKGNLESKANHPLKETEASRAWIGATSGECRCWTHPIPQDTVMQGHQVSLGLSNSSEGRPLFPPTNQLGSQQCSCVVEWLGPT